MLNFFLFLFGYSVYANVASPLSVSIFPVFSLLLFYPLFSFVLFAFLSRYLLLYFCYHSNFILISNMICKFYFSPDWSSRSEAGREGVRDVGGTREESGRDELKESGRQ